MGERRTNRGCHLPPEILTEEEVHALLRACSAKAATGIRNRALIAVLYRSGLRISEALCVYPKDVDPSAGAIRVLHGKGKRARTVGIDPGAMAIIEPWFDMRTRIGLRGKQRLFCTLEGRPMRDSYVRVLLPRLARKAGLEKRVHAHGFRHTHAAQLRAEGVDIGVISKQLGHQSIATTARYLDHIAPLAVIETMRSRRWSG